MMKKINFVDVAIFLTIILSIFVGFLTFKHFRQTAQNQVESTSKIIFQVFVRGATLTGNTNPIVIGEESFITIRNVPYTGLKVLDSKIDTKKINMPNPKNDGKGFLIVDDYSQIFMYDIIATFEDTAKITKDGAVVGGNKIKIGLPITLEGPTYKLNGTVSNVLIQNSNPQKMPQTNANSPEKGPQQPTTQAPAAQAPVAGQPPVTQQPATQQTAAPKQP